MSIVPIFLIIGLLVSAIVGYFIRVFVAKQQTETAETKANELIQEAKNKQQEILF